MKFFALIAMAVAQTPEDYGYTSCLTDADCSLPEFEICVTVNWVSSDPTVEGYDADTDAVIQALSPYYICALTADCQADQAATGTAIV